MPRPNLMIDIDSCSEEEWEQFLEDVEELVASEPPEGPKPDVPLHLRSWFPHLEWED